MANLSKAAALIIVVFFATSTLMMAESACAQVTKPSVPEFTIQYADHSYEAPPTYTKDPYTGQSHLSSPGYHVDNRTIDLTIKNQAFTPYTDANGNSFQLQYNVRSKGHFDDWDSSSIRYLNSFQTSTSTYTVISINVASWNIPAGGQIDFQVQATTSYTTYSSSSSGSSAAYGCGGVSSEPTPQTTVENSDWSGSQTVTVGAYNPIGSVGAFFGVSWETLVLIVIVVVVVLVGVVLAIVYFVLRRPKNPGYPPVQR
jgi:hypothetical protein